MGFVDIINIDCFPTDKIDKQERYNKFMTQLAPANKSWSYRFIEKLFTILLFTILW